MDDKKSIQSYEVKNLIEESWSGK